MRTLILDTETRSAKDLRSCGPYVYSEDPIQYVDGQVIDGFEMLMVSWQFLDKGKTRWWSPLDVYRSDYTLIDEFYSSLTDPDVRKIAHNAQFDRVILSRRLQRNGVLGKNEFLDPRQWIDTMAVAAVHGLPKGLDHLVKFYKVGGKLSDGKAVIQFFNRFSNRLLLEEALSKDDLLGELAELLHADKTLGIDALRNMPAPRGFATEKKHLLQLYDVREKWKTYRSYSIHDTDILVDVAKKLPRIPEEEQRFWELDQEINDRGVLIDLDLAKSAYHRFQVSSEAVTNDLKKIMACENPRSIPQFKNWLGLAGVEVSSLDKAHVETLLLAPDTPPIVKKALEMRQTISASSTAKFTAMEDRCNHDGRARGCFQYFGAHTGRAAGRGIQLQNLPRIPGKQVPLAEFLADNPELLETASLDQVKYMLRACLIAPPGDVFSIADFSSIEARVTAWLAGEQWVLDSARAGHDLYKATWAQMSGKTVEEVSDEERQRGKVATLALGYAGGVKALLRMGGDKLPIPNEFAEPYRQQLVEEHELMRPPKAQAEAYRAWRRWNLDTEFDMTVRDAYLDDLKLTWRAANPNIKRFWYDVANGFKTAAFLGHQTEVGRLSFAPCEGKNTCGIRLPSGRVMKYRFIRTKVEVDEDGRKRDALVFRNGIGITVYTHGGKLVENVVQAVARDLLRDAMLRASDAGARIVAHIHDEIVAEGQFDLASFMVDNPSWAPGLPLNASVAETSRYLGH